MQICVCVCSSKMQHLPPLPSSPTARWSPLDRRPGARTAARVERRRPPAGGAAAAQRRRRGLPAPRRHPARALCALGQPRRGNSGAQHAPGATAAGTAAAAPALGQRQWRWRRHQRLPAEGRHALVRAGAPRERARRRLGGGGVCRHSRGSRRGHHAARAAAAVQLNHGRGGWRWRRRRRRTHCRKARARDCRRCAAAQRQRRRAGSAAITAAATAPASWAPGARRRRRAPGARAAHRLRLVALASTPHYSCSSRSSTHKQTPYSSANSPYYLSLNQERRRGEQCFTHVFHKQCNYEGSGQRGLFV